MMSVLGSLASMLRRKKVGGGTPYTPPVSGETIQTEGGDDLITEGGDTIVVE